MPVILASCLTLDQPWPAAPSVEPREPTEHAGASRMALPVRDVVIPELRRALDQLYPDSAPRPDACVFGVSLDSTPAAVLAVLAAYGRVWVDPDALLYHSPHALTGTACIHLGIDGAGVTFSGGGASGAALGYGALLVKSGRAGHVLVGSVRPGAMALAILLAGTDDHRGAGPELTVCWDGGLYPAADLVAERLFAGAGGYRAGEPITVDLVAVTESDS